MWRYFYFFAFRIFHFSLNGKMLNLKIKKSHIYIERDADHMRAHAFHAGAIDQLHLTFTVYSTQQCWDKIKDDATTFTTRSAPFFIYYAKYNHVLVLIIALKHIFETLKAHGALFNWLSVNINIRSSLRHAVTNPGGCIRTCVTLLGTSMRII